jgi:hypothetical protein
MIGLPLTRNGGAVLVFAVLLVCYGYFFPMLNNWGSNSRMNLIYALGDQRQLRIDDYHQNTGDKAHFRGHYFMEKTISPSLMGLPFYLVFKAVARLPTVARLATGDRAPGALPTLDEVYRKYHLPSPGTAGSGHPPIYHAMALVFVTFFAVAVPSALTGAVLFLFASRFCPSPGRAVALAFALGLATPAFSYSNQLYQHQATAFGAFVGCFLLWRIIHEHASTRWLWIVGVLFGYAATSEFVWAPVLTGITVWLGRHLDDRRTLWRVAAAAAPWFMATAVYNLLAFETPLPVGYRYSPFANAFESALFGFGWPSWQSVYGITFSPYRGLFFLCPFLLLAPVGLYVMFHREREVRTRELASMLLGTAMLIFLYNACYWDWTGADSVGPRHLIALVPFLSLPISFVLNRFTRASQLVVFGGLVALSGVGVWMQSLAGQTFPREAITRPILDYALPLLRERQLRFSVGTVLGFRGFTVFIPLLALLGATFVCVSVGERAWLRRVAKSPPLTV